MMVEMPYRNIKKRKKKTVEARTADRADTIARYQRR